MNDSITVFYKNNYKIDSSTIWSNFFLLIPGILLLILYVVKKGTTKHVFYNNLILVLGVIVLLSAIFSICHHTRSNHNLCCKNYDPLMFYLDVIFCSLAVYLSFAILIYFSFYISQSYTYNIIMWVVIIFLTGLNIYFYVMSQKYLKLCDKDINMDKKYIKFNTSKGMIPEEVKNIRESCDFKRKYNFYHSMWHIMGSIICLAIFFVIFRY